MTASSGPVAAFVGLLYVFRNDRALMSWRYSVFVCHADAALRLAHGVSAIPDED